MTLRNAIENPEDDILLNHDVVKLTDSFINSGKMPHAIMFAGNEWVGKTHNALFFARKLLSQKRKEQNITEETEITEDILSHPDLLYISKDKKNKNISVEQIRELSKFLSLTPSKSLHRVTIINPVEELNINSSNALLKALEEPTGNSVIILICHNKHKILETIKSRCLIIDFKNLTEDKYFNSEVTKGLDRAKLKEIQKISNNSPFIAKEILDSNVNELYKDFRDLISEDNINLNKLSSLAKKLKDESNTKIESNFYKLLLSDESNRIKKGNISKQRIDNWFALLKIYRDKNYSNLDSLDSLKEIINIIKYK